MSYWQDGKLGLWSANFKHARYVACLQTGVANQLFNVHSHVIFLATTLITTDRKNFRKNTSSIIHSKTFTG